MRVSPKNYAEMVTVQGGTLPAGSGLAGQTVATFQIGKYEVTWGEWKTVRDWAVANGYTDLVGIGAGSGDEHPVQQVSWYDVVKWCNAKSQKEGLMPVYEVLELVSSGGGFTIYTPKTYKTGQSVPMVNSTANGFRLPTVEEWEWASRGGVSSQGYIYSGSNNLNEVAWYLFNSSGGTVNIALGRGTWPVGMKVSNELGIFDMSGNIMEWCWDEFDSITRYSRGGHWNDTADLCAVAAEGGSDDQGARYFSNGFRLAQSEAN